MTADHQHETVRVPADRESSRLARSVKAQFALPRGPLGRLTGWVMVKAGEYSGLNEAAIGRLDLHGGERVLEIGFGPGEAIHLIAERASCRVAGIDPSPVMLARARRRNRSAVRDGRVELRQGIAEHLPWPRASFDAILAVNTAQLWTPLSAGITEACRVLAPGGRIVLAVHQRCVTQDGGSVCGLDLRPRLEGAMTAAGLEVSSESPPGKGGTASYLTGVLSNGGASAATPLATAARPGG